MLDSVSARLLGGLEEGISTVELCKEIANSAGYPALQQVILETEGLYRLGLFQLESLDTAEYRASELRAYHNHHPKKLMLLVQTSCNLKCAYCYEVKGGFHNSIPNRSMTMDSARASIDMLVRRSGKRVDLEVTFFGGEPLINFKTVKDVVEYCKQLEGSTPKRFAFSMTTNATLMTQEVIDFLVAHKFAVMISLDGRPETSDQVRMDLGGRGVGERATANAKALISAQVSAGLRPAMIRATLSHDNHDARDVELYFHEQGFSRTMVGTSMGRAHAKTSADLDQADIRDLHTNLDESIDEYIQWMTGQGPPPMGHGLERGLRDMAEKLSGGPPKASVGCGVGRNMLAHTADGKIYPCHRYAGEEAYIVGSNRDGIDEARLNEFYSQILAVYDQHCSGCWARALCGGQCAHYISRPDGQVSVPDKASCDSLRTAFEKRLWLYGKVKAKGSERGQSEECQVGVDHESGQ